MFPLLETLVAVYEVGQFTLAADELKVSQSTVSSRIAQLEQMVGAPLFVRNANVFCQIFVGRFGVSFSPLGLVPFCWTRR